VGLAHVGAFGHVAEALAHLGEARVASLDHRPLSGELPLAFRPGVGALGAVIEPSNNRLSRVSCGTRAATMQLHPARPLQEAT